MGGTADAIPDATAQVQGTCAEPGVSSTTGPAGLATAFTEAGLGVGSKVGLFLYNAPEFMESYFAALKIRAVPFNVNYRYVEKELLYLLDNADAEALVFHSTFSETVSRILPRLPGLRLVVAVDDGGQQLDTVEGYEPLIGRHEPAPRITRHPDDVTMIYTGGTTGMPKGVVSKIGSTVQDLLTTTPAMIGEQPATTPEDAIAIAQRFFDEGRQFVTIPAPPLIHNTALGIGANPTLLFGGRVVLLERPALGCRRAVGRRRS